MYSISIYYVIRKAPTEVSITKQESCETNNPQALFRTNELDGLKMRASTGRANAFVIEKFSAEFSFGGKSRSSSSSSSSSSNTQYSCTGRTVPSWELGRLSEKGER